MTAAATPDTEGVTRALDAADIPPERCGTERTSRLTPAELALYRWVLRAFAAGDVPTAAEVGAEAGRLGLDAAEPLSSFARDDLVHTDTTGRIVVAYPFSGVRRGHRVLIDGEHHVEAMCAIDALGIAPMLGLPIEVVSHDPVNGIPVQVSLDPEGGLSAEPATAVVLAGSACRHGPSYRGCCDVLNFFSSQRTAEEYLRTHPDVSGHPITMTQAAECGRVIFADLLEEA